jgi:transposase
MQAPDEVETMLRLQGLGRGAKRIAAELGCSRNTVRRYLRQGGWVGYQAAHRRGALDGHSGWLAQRFRQHRGNADVIRQELAQELGIAVSLRTVERAVRHLRRELAAQAAATVRFETAPGRQLQIDFGSTFVCIGDAVEKVFLFVATLGYCRRNFVLALRHERQTARFDGLEAAFGHFGGVPRELLLDNARALVLRHNPATREIVFNDRFHAFCRYWDVRPRACAPYRARTKGKDESGVKYVKRNAIAGRRFATWAALEAHLVAWTRDVADRRVHGTTGEPPIVRFARDEAASLTPLHGRPPFRQVRDVTRRVRVDSCIDLDTNQYSVPWRLVGAEVSVEVAAGTVRIFHGGAEVAHHDERQGRRQRAIEPSHLRGIIADTRQAAEPIQLACELLRPLAEYEQIAGGGWATPA